MSVATFDLVLLDYRVYIAQQTVWPIRQINTTVTDCIQLKSRLKAIDSVNYTNTVPFISSTALQQKHNRIKGQLRMPKKICCEKY